MSVSIVITNYNGRPVLEKHLPAVLKSVSPTDEVIVVDDASTDDSVAFLKQHFQRVKVLVNRENVRYAESCNRGVSEAVHDIVVLLNNDVSPQKDFLSHLVPHFSDPAVFAVGCLEIGNHGFESGRSVGRFERGMLRHRRARDQQKNSTLWAAGGSMAVRKSLWQKIGGMDRLFRPAYKEDIDLSYRAQKAGWKVLFEPKAKVLHIHETTNAQIFGQSNIRVTSYKNEFLFLWKNLTDTDLLVSHFFWLIFYILPVLGIQTRGEILVGFTKALAQLGELLKKRRDVMKLWKVKDIEIIQQVEE